MVIKLSKKDKSLLLLIATFAVILWFLFGFLAKIVLAPNFSSSDLGKVLSAYDDNDGRWLNLSRPLKKEDLEGRVVLLDFWTYACVNCLHAIPEIKKLEKEFGNKLMVIGVHSGKFDNEKDPRSILKAVLKHDISHAVINDSNLKIWDAFKIKAWPSFVLIDPDGRVKKRYVGENDVKYIRKDVKRMVDKYRYHLNRDALPILLEKNKVVKTVLSYPTKIAYAKKFSYKSYAGNAFFIANSGRNNILVARKNGEVMFQIGLKKSGLRDGHIENARFDNPMGMVFRDGKLYVADSSNHALRVVDFKKRKVSTLIGDGRRGEVISGKKLDAEVVLLASPTDLEFFPDKNHIAIANSGTHQILSYNIKTKKVDVLAGNGNEGIADGGDATLAQTADLSEYDGKLYFLDSESSSLRVLDKKGRVKTLIGKGLFDFGHKNGAKKEALMQHPLGLFVNRNGAYISDSFNHRIRKYEFHRKKIKDLFGGKRGDILGKDMQFDEPEDIYVVKDDMYVLDTNNNRLVKINFKKMSASLVNVMPPLQLPKDGFLQYLPNLQKSKMVKVRSKDVRIKIGFDEGWKINEKGPSFLNLLEMVGEKKANLIRVFDWNMIKNNEIILPELDEDKDYVLQGTIYYCQDKRGALCYIISHEQQIKVSKRGAKEVKIEL